MKKSLRASIARTNDKSQPELAVLKYRHCCKDMRFYIDEGKVGIRWRPQFRTYHIQLTTSSALQEIRYCPWCGARLPKSLWNEWFRKLATMGVEFPYQTPKLVPVAMRSEAWWINRPSIPAARKQRVKP